jgi:hypothetical protein
MPKRPKNWTPTPAERGKQRAEARAKILNKGGKVMISLYAKGITTEMEGYEAPKHYYWFDEFRAAFEQEYDGIMTLTEITEPEKPKDPLAEFTDDWYERNK